jgi:hypothetical protein
LQQMTIIVFLIVCCYVRFPCRGHRAMHHPRIYWIHKPHHKWHHTVSLAVLHIHPLEYIISNVVVSTTYLSARCASGNTVDTSIFCSQRQADPSCAMLISSPCGYGTMCDCARRLKLIAITPFHSHRQACYTSMMPDCHMVR